MKLHHPAPICIASPTRRSGTTLIQRLLCSASNTLIYGETCANDLNILASLFSTKEMLLSQGASERDGQLQRVLQGEVNEWIADLMPPVATYLDNNRGTLYNLSDRLAAYAAAQNRPIWGVKMAEWHPGQLLQLQQCLPGTKIIYLHRELADCLRSAKRLDMVASIQEVQRFCQTWQQFGTYARTHLQGATVLHLDYEDLLANPVVTLARIAEFTGSVPMDEAVFRKRINTDAFDSRLQETATDYLSPAMLSAEEEQVVATYAKTSAFTS